MDRGIEIRIKANDRHRVAAMMITGLMTRDANIFNIRVIEMVIHLKL